MRVDFEEDIELPYVRGDWPVEMWLLDPGPFIDIAFDQGVSRFVFRAQYHARRDMRQNPLKYLEFHSRGRPWEAVWVSFYEKVAVLVSSEHPYVSDPLAVWPVWPVGSPNNLQKLIDVPWSSNPDLLLSGVEITNVDASKITVFPREDQANRIFVSRMPAPDPQWATTVSWLLRRQDRNRDVTLHFHGQKSIHRSIGVRVPSFDHPVRLSWDNGLPRLLLPNGMTWRTKTSPASEQYDLWLKLIGYSTAKVKRLIIDGEDRTSVSRTAYDINLRSLRWAMLNYDRAWDFRRAGLAGDDVDADSPDYQWEPSSLPVRFTRRRLNESNFDRWMCDACSQSLVCPYSRKGSVCIVPGSEAEDLAKKFHTRSSAQIIDGLGTLLGAQTRRLHRAMELEEEAIEAARVAAVEKGEVKIPRMDPEVTKIINSVFDRATTLARLVDPALAGKSKVNVNLLNVGQVTGGAAIGPPPTSATLMAAVAGELESRGVKIEDATPEMVEEILSEAAGGSIIDAEVVESDEDEMAEE